MPLTSGARFGPYEIVALLGRGGMGEVYRARDTKLHRDVALKVLPELFAHDPERLARFRREAQLLASLNHPNIATIHGLEDAGGVQALVLELVDGPTLAEIIASASLDAAPSAPSAAATGESASRGAAARGGGAPRAIKIEDSLAIARQIVEALEAAHEHGIMHRDLKPANVKVRPDGTVKVLDFGLAKLGTDGSTPTDGSGRAGGTDGADEDPLANSPTMTAATGAGVILGTAAYMSPEQARGKPVDKRTDVWAFGCVLYEMLTGRRAFEGDSVTDVLARILEREPDFHALPATTPQPIRRLLRRSLEKDRKRRLPDIAVARLEIEEALNAAAADVASHTATASPSRRPLKAAWIAAAVAGLAIAALAVPATLYFRRAAPEAAITRLDVMTPATGDPFSFALSPDGRRLAFVASVEGESRLWVRSLDLAVAQPLPGTNGASYPFWSPDGQAIAFFADAKLKRIELSGSTLRVLADAPSGRGGTWSRDGVIVFAARFNAGLTRVDGDGGAAAALAPLEAGQSSHRWPQFLPDGRFLFYSIAEQQPERRGVYIGSLDGGQPTRLLAADSPATYAPPGYLLRVSQGVLLAHPFDVAGRSVSEKGVPVAEGVGVDSRNFRAAVSVSDSGVLAHRTGTGAWRQLVWADRNGKTQNVPGSSVETWNATGVMLAPDGSRVAGTRIVQQNPDIWLLDIGLGIGSRFTFHPALENYVLWSPDSRWLVFSSNRSAKMDLFIRPADGSGDEQPLLATAGDKAAQDWSPDGRLLLYSTQDPKTRADLWALPITSGGRSGQAAKPDVGQPFPVAQTEFEESQGQFSPDVKWVAYTSNETGRSEVYVRAFPGTTGKRQVSTSGGIYPRWARDGRELFYVTLDNRLMSVPVRAAPDGQTLAPAPAVELFRTHLATPGGNTALLGFTSRPEYSVAPDGRFLMNVNVEEATASPITLVLNWTAALHQGK